MLLNVFLYLFLILKNTILLKYEDKENLYTNLYTNAYTNWTKKYAIFDENVEE